jgi:hypothetical protein
MTFETKIRKIAELQFEYQKLVNSKKLTKKAICDLCIPLRDDIGCTDIDILKIARKEIGLTEIIKIIDENSKPKYQRGLNTLSDEEYSLLNQIAEDSGMNSWFMIVASGTTLYVYDIEDRRELSLSTGVKILLEGVNPEMVSDTPIHKKTS